MQGTFRKKPVAVSVVSVDEILADVDDRLRGLKPASTLPDWAQQAIHDGVIALSGDGVRIKTLESGHGSHIAGPTDIVIRGVKGELYPCKADIFAATYEPAECIAEKQLIERDAATVALFDLQGR